MITKKAVDVFSTGETWFIDQTPSNSDYCWNKELFNACFIVNVSLAAALSLVTFAHFLSSQSDSLTVVIATAEKWNAPSPWISLSINQSEGCVKVPAPDSF